eukprot:CAMPEP_0197853314 /NCGR_PEP_ID=MMETSP1438-20131217/22517_1 /TAXON_ID=1461541 /ORGANISM="Pterosperma sp., Strain CCMP1384" /LENGTH=523 /DNA_ID=CAMNT_0043467685 /DNA_START=70 /DNA_END=1641 /DNA_ORIENTATION=+
MRALLLAIVGFASVTTVAGIHSVTGDLDGSCGATLCTNAAGTSAAQSANMPAVFSTNFNDIIGGVHGSAWNSQSMAYKRKTSSTYVKFYVKCVGMTTVAPSIATYTLSYVLDGAPAKVVGSAFTAASNPYILIEDLSSGAHSLTTTCTENKDSISAGNPLTSTVESDPLIFNWIVDTAGAQSVSFTSTPAKYDGVAHQSFTFTSSRSQDAYGSLTWMCKFAAASSSWYSCGSAGATTTSTTITTNLLPDGEYTFEVKALLTPTTGAAGGVDEFFLSDLTPSPLTATASYSWTKDTVLPVLAITSSPAAKSQWFAGKTAKFEFACKAGEVSCSYMCSFDGKDSADYTSTTAQPGFFPCTSPLTIPVKDTTTHSFRAYALDAAGNPSAYSPLHMFYADGTTPKVYFDAVDTSQAAIEAAQQTVGLYYATAPTVTTTGGALQTSAGAATAVTSDGVSFSTPLTSTSYHTVFQFKYSPSTPVYQLSNTYGAILANKKVNGKWYYNVVDSTNANEGKMSYHCEHTEMN